MAGYIKELFMDLCHGRADLITKCDLISTLQHLFNTRQIDRHDITVLIKYSQGYTITDLSFDYPNAAERIIRILALAEYESGYTDEAYLRRITVVHPQYNKNIQAYRNALHLYGRTFE